MDLMKFIREQLQCWNCQNMQSYKIKDYVTIKMLHLILFLIWADRELESYD
jgi:hypothetical protein